MLYGLKSSGRQWWLKCSKILKAIRFHPTKTEDDIWLREKWNKYEYIVHYVDDLAIISHDPQSIINQLETEHKLKLKGARLINYHLGCNFFQDKNNTLCMAAKKYVDKLINTYFRLFRSKPKTNISSPLEHGDHPELDNSEELSSEGIKKYQSLIGALQWVVLIRRFDLATSVMRVSKFRASPCQGHLEIVKRICCYLAKMKHGTLHFHVRKPD